MAAAATVLVADIDRSSGGLGLDCLSHIDISTLSQSELHALSLLSSKCVTDDLVVPKIDRSQFNESAGSRRQTYSRLRRRRRVAGPKLSPPPTLQAVDDSERNENHSIIAHLKHLISNDPKFDQIDRMDLQPTPLPLPPPPPPMASPSSAMTSRKRGRKPKVKVGESMGVGMQIVNERGVAVDLLGLQNAENPFGDELRRRTAGLEGEEELLGFMTQLGGQWGSRRKRRKIVDAAQFGDTLPLGWKLLLALKRKEGRAWIYCRRYISPTGQQFLSCKEVASFLESFFGLNNNAQRQDVDGGGGEDILEDRIVSASGNHADIDGDTWQDGAAISNAPAMQVTVLKIGNLAEGGTFECHKCSMNFADKDSYLQHLLSFHQRTTRRYRLGSTVGDGVIIKDGKYECQFCHKVFLERRRYNGHVGIHVRNYVRRVEESPALDKIIESPTRDALQSRNSKMDALIEIAQCSILETSAAGLNDDELKGGTTPNPYKNASSSEIPASSSNQEINIEQDLEDPMIEEINEDKQDSEHTITDGSMEEAGDAMEVIDAKMDSSLITTVLSAEKNNGKTSECAAEKMGLASASDEFDMSGTKQDRASECQCLDAPSNDQSITDVINSVKSTREPEPPSPMEVDQNKHIEQIGSFDQPQPANYTFLESHASETKELHCGSFDSSVSQVPPFCLATSTPVLQKGEQHLIDVGQRSDHVTGLERRKQHEMEPQMHGSAAGQDSALLEVPMDLTRSSNMQKESGSSIQFESEDVLNIAGSDQLTTACVWCGVKFRHEAVDHEVQPDSVGFMCPLCKAKNSERVERLAH